VTDLQLGLAVIGAIAIAAVLVYNRLQERAVRRETERAFQSRHADVLTGAPAERREPSLGPLPEHPRHAEPAAASAQPDPRVDYLIALAAPAGIDAARLHESWVAIERRFGRRALLAEVGGGWQAGLQMVSRDGVVSDAELLEFRSEVETVAAALGATASAPEMRRALDGARELDRACADADIQVALHVVGGSPDEELARLGEPPFGVERRADRVTLILDVARTAEPGRVFAAMARAGLQLAAQGGRLADDNGNAVDDRVLAAISAELEVVRQSLVEKGIEPGGALALRLFS
jgi:hypothetical protein